MARTKATRRARPAKPRKVDQRPGELATLLQMERSEECRTLEVMAQIMRISKSHLSDIEKGRKVVSLERAVRFAELLDLPMAEVVRLALQDQLARAGIELTVVVS